MRRCAILQPKDNTESVLPGPTPRPGLRAQAAPARALGSPRAVAPPRSPRAPAPFGSAPLGSAGRPAAEDWRRPPSLPSAPPPSCSPQAGGAAAVHRGLAPRLCLPRLPPPAAGAALCGGAAAQHGRDGLAARRAVPAEPAGDLGERVLPTLRAAPGTGRLCVGWATLGFPLGSAHLFPAAVAGGRAGGGGGYPPEAKGPAVGASSSGTRISVLGALLSSGSET